MKLRCRTGARTEHKSNFQSPAPCHLARCSLLKQYTQLSHRELFVQCLGKLPNGHEISYSSFLPGFVKKKNGI